MHHPDEPADIAEELDADMPPTDLTKYTDAQVFAWTRQFAAQLAAVRENRKRFGKLAADCRRRGLNWQAVSDMVDLPLPTVHRLAQPYSEVTGQ
jgi:hypothetical protein